MATSPLLDVTRTPPRAPGRDNDALGPSDSSDSGSDVAGLADLDPNDQNAPLDVALDADNERPQTALDVFAPGSDTDASGTGERRSAGLDSGEREATDILPDHIVGGSAIEGERADELLARPDDEDDEEEADEEDEDADPVGDDESIDDEDDDGVPLPKKGGR